MAEWGKYLKNAVANVEQQLDKVLLENQNQAHPRASVSPAASTRRAPRPDLQERLRRAATASKGDRSNSNASTPQPGDDRSSVPPPEQTSGVAAETVVGDESEGTGPAKAGADLDSSADAGAARPDLDLTSTAAATELEDILTSREIVIAPDIGPLLNQARRIALAHKSDDTLDFVDALEAYKAESDAHDDSVAERMKSMNSKIAYLSQERAETTSGSEQKVALLLEEGQRLSQQELKLGLIIKKLRSERTASLAKDTLVQTKDKELAVLRAEKTAILNQLKEQEALAEHFRGLAESSSVGGLGVSDDSASADAAGVDAGDSGKSTYANLKRRLDAAESNHEVAKRTWHDLESSLLTRIAELEINADARANAATQLQNSLKEAQESARDTRNQMIALQDELDAGQEKWHAAEMQLQAELDGLREQLKQEQLMREHLEKEQPKPKPELEQLETDAKTPAMLDQIGLQPDMQHQTKVTTALDTSSVPPSPRAPVDIRRSSDLTQASTATDSRSASGYARADDTRPPPLPPFGDSVFANSSEFLNGADGPVGPAGPFGSLADDFDDNHRPNLSRDDSRDMFEDSLSFMAPSASRRESSIVGSEAVHGSQLHIVKKLTLTVRRLENELSTVRKACELSDRQREEAQSEVVRLVDAEDSLAALQQKYSELEAANTELAAEVKRLEASGIDKDERIEELDADVRDLKEMYREQVEALVTEIEGLKK